MIRPQGRRYPMRRAAPVGATDTEAITSGRSCMSQHSETTHCAHDAHLCGTGTNACRDVYKRQDAKLTLDLLRKMPILKLI